jgi:hypothetical protein
MARIVYQFTELLALVQGELKLIQCCIDNGYAEL